MDLRDLWKPVNNDSNRPWNRVWDRVWCHKTEDCGVGLLIRIHKFNNMLYRSGGCCGCSKNGGSKASPPVPHCCVQCAEQHVQYVYFYCVRLVFIHHKSFGHSVHIWFMFADICVVNHTVKFLQSPNACRVNDNLKYCPCQNSLAKANFD